MIEMTYLKTQKGLQRWVKVLQHRHTWNGLGINYVQ